MEPACAGCPGHCCVAFYLPAHHERVGEIRCDLTDGDQIAEASGLSSKRRLDAAAPRESR